MAVEIWKTAEERITRALADLQKAQPFFAHLAMGLKPTVENSMSSAGVDAKGKMYYNQEFIKKLSIDECMGLICHEVLHVALLHMMRIGSRNHLVSNLAQDAVVNSAVVKSNLQLPSEGAVKIHSYQDSATIKMPDGCGVPDIDIKNVSEKNWEQIYDEILPKMPKDFDKQNGVGQAIGSEPGGEERQWGFDEHMRGDLTEEEQANSENEWKSRLCEAANYAKQMGQLPSGMSRIIDGLLKPKVQWKSLLLRYLKAHFSPVDWSYSRPSKKSHALGVYLPNTLKEAVECEIYVDTSGSVSQKELSEFLTEIVAIARSMNHITMYVTFIDAAISEDSRYKVDNGEIAKILAMKPQGGGGTDMEVGLDYCKLHNPSIPVALVFTDGYVPIRKSAQDYPFDVVWVVTPNGTTSNFTYGDVIQMDK